MLLFQNVRKKSLVMLRLCSKGTIYLCFRSCKNLLLNFPFQVSSPSPDARETAQTWTTMLGKERPCYAPHATAQNRVPWSTSTYRTGKHKICSVPSTRAKKIWCQKHKRPVPVEIYPPGHRRPAQEVFHEWALGVQGRCSGSRRSSICRATSVGQGISSAWLEGQPPDSRSSPALSDDLIIFLLQPRNSCCFPALPCNPTNTVLLPRTLPILALIFVLLSDMVFSYCRLMWKNSAWDIFEEGDFYFV